MTMESKRIIIVTGAAKGIGYAIAKKFSENGDFVAICDLSLESAEKAAATLTNAKGYQVDVSKEEDIRNFVETIIAEKGRIDVLVNNAGIQHIDKVEDFPVDKWRLLLDIMLTGPFLMIKYILPHMKQQRFGRIINISSAHGRMASPYKSAYVSAKHGIVGLTRTVALETALFGITANTIMPGPVRTDIITNQLAKLAATEGISEEEALKKHILKTQPMQRLLEPEEIANTVFFVASKEASAITGEEINVTGGI